MSDQPYVNALNRHLADMGWQYDKVTIERDRFIVRVELVLGGRSVRFESNNFDHQAATYADVDLAKEQLNAAWQSLLPG